MTFYKNINIIRCIADLKNGLPIFFDYEYKTLKNTSKNFYFAKQYANEELLKGLKIEKITTKEKFERTKEINFLLPKTKEETALLDILKLAEIEPILFKTTTLPEDFKNTAFFTFKPEEAEDFKQNFSYTLKLVSQAPIALKYAKEAKFFVFRTPIFTNEHYLIQIGKPDKKSPLVRIHSSCYTGDLLASLRCDCREQLQETIKFIAEHKEYKGGYICYLMQEGRGIGLANKIEAYRLQQEEKMDTVESNLALGFLEEERNFTPAFKMLEFLNVKSINLITNNPKKAKEIEKFGVIVEKTIPTFFQPNEYNEEYLKVKQSKMHHKFKSSK